MRIKFFEFIHRNVDSLTKTLTSKIQTQRVIMTLYSQKVKKHCTSRTFVCWHLILPHCHQPVISLTQLTQFLYHSFETDSFQWKSMFSCIRESGSTASSNFLSIRRECGISKETIICSSLSFQDFKSVLVFHSCLRTLGHQRISHGILWSLYPLFYFPSL